MVVVSFVVAVATYKDKDIFAFSPNEQNVKKGGRDVVVWLDVKNDRTYVFFIFYVQQLIGSFVKKMRLGG